MTPREAKITYAAIYAVVRLIPPGKIATYGQVAALAGLAGHARQVGYALHRCGKIEDVPWQRVVNSRGEISERSAKQGSEALQRVMLEAEGVGFTAAGKIDLERYRWDWEGAQSSALSADVPANPLEDLPIDLDRI